MFQDKERDCCKSNSSQFTNHLLFSVLSQMSMAEKQYMALTYLAPKRFLMKDVRLFWQLGALQWVSEICKSLDFKCLIKGWFENGPHFKWDLKFGSPIIMQHRLFLFIYITDGLDRTYACLMSVLLLLWIMIRCGILRSKDWPLPILVPHKRTESES